MKTNNWSLQTKFLHIGLVLTVSAQLLISLVMTAPDDTGNAVSRAAFEMHEIVGLTALAIVLLHWGWTLFSHADGGLENLFPVSQQARQDLIDDVKGLKKGKLPETGKKGGLIGLVHGLGLLAVTGIAVTGGALFILFPETGEPGAMAEAFAEVHEGFATLVWTYWIGHGGMAIMHHLNGEELLKSMFTLKHEKLIDPLAKDEHLVTQHASIHPHKK